MNKRIAKLIGDRYGNLTVINFSHTKGGSSYWHCKCDCGAVKVVNISCLKSNTRSCGCWRKLLAIENGLRSVWDNMIQRCYNTRSQYYPKYGGLGIQTDGDWLVYNNFERDTKHGYEKGMKLARFDENSNYGPKNFYWKPAKKKKI